MALSYAEIYELEFQGANTMYLLSRAVLLFFCSYAYVSAIYHTTFCMPTAKRDVSYLDQVVASYTSQEIFHMDGVTLYIMDVDNSTGNKGIPSMENRQVADCGDSTDNNVGPSCKVRQQGLDVIAAITRCARLTSGWVLLTEDDCEACEGALVEVISTLAGLDRDTTAMAKFSKFTRATAFPVEVVAMYTRSVLDRLHVFPYDVTIIEEWAPGRRLYIHPRNLFHHVGYVSTEPSRNAPAYRQAYAELRGDVCFERLA